MALSDVELGMLNSLMYDSGLFDEGGSSLVNRSLGDILTEYVRSAGYANCSESQRLVIEKVLADSALWRLRLIDKDSYTDRGSRAIAFRDPLDGEVYIVFQGTGTGDGASIDGVGTNSEWYTDAMGMAQSDTDPQIAALLYVEYIAQRYGCSVTVTGHSNGANKAMYCAILSEYVKRAVAFDGQGFSAAFFQKYAEYIERNCGKIVFYGQEGDYVGPLLKMLPVERHYVKHGSLNARDWAGANLANNHGIDSLFTEVDGEFAFVEGEPSWMNAEIQRFMSYLYDTYPPEVLETMAPLLGQLLDSLLGTSERSFQDLIGDPSLAQAWAYFINALAMYEGLDDLVASVVGALADAVAPDVAAQMGGFSAESILRLIHLGTKPFNVVGNALDGGRKLVRGVDQWISNVTTGGARGNRNAVRDFTEAKRQELLSIVREVESEPWYDPTRWDVWYRGERWFGLLTIQNYQNDMRTYYRKTIDVDGVTEGQINEIFDNVESLSRRFRDSSVRASFKDPLSNIAQSMRTCI